ncbi:MAG: hypothetical protein JWO05_471 [Gemmatimonadetes bacterium]|nr:hypothetical protein [Gemmatimonadota bacterium]
MLSIDFRSLHEQAAIVEGEVSADDPAWREGDTLPEGAVHVSGRVSAAGEDRYYWHGTLTGMVTIPCRRCLTPTSEAVESEFHFILVEDGTEGADDDPDVFVIPAGAHEADLAPIVREQWVLDAPQFLLCREDCKGLCPTCGADLNAGDCGCIPVPKVTGADPRWDALRKLGGQSS